MPEKRTAEYWIKKLALEPHPEGGYFRETYRSKEIIPGSALPERYGADRSFSTTIYYLLKGSQISVFHRLKSDEFWHFYDGSACEIPMIDARGNLKTVSIGLNAQAGEKPQVLIPANTWFAGKVVNVDSFILAGCTVAPGFDFADFETAKRSELCKTFPQHTEIIEAFTHE